MIKNIENYYLNMPVRESYDLKEFGLDEYRMFESVGVKRIFKDEKIYHGKDISFQGVIWNTMIGATQGMIYKISIQNISTDKVESERMLKSAYDYLFKEMGKHNDYSSSDNRNRYVWDTTEGNVILDQACKSGVYAVQIFLTSSLIKRQPENLGQAYEVWKHSERIFREYTTSLSSYPIIISIAMLLLALLKMPYSYYTIMRLMVFGTAIYTAYKAKKLNERGWMWVMVSVAVIFNPIMPVYLHKSTWALFDVGGAVTFAIYLAKSKSSIKLASKK